MLYEPTRNVLLYRTPNPLAIAAKCHDARQLPDGTVVVPAHLQNLQELRRLELPVHRYLDGWYEWPRAPEIKEPFEAQKITANFLVTNPRAYVLSDMGTGKTLAALWAADALMRHYPPGQCRALIICPLSTMRRVWSDEIFRNFLGKRTCGVLHGDAAKREKILAEPHDFYVLNHDGLKVGVPNDSKKPWTKLAKALAERPDIRIVIVDEGSGFSDATTDRSKVARKQLTHRDYLWLMTGTPTPNGPLDAYGLAKLVNGAYGESFRAYRERSMMQVSQFKWLPKVGSQQIVGQLLSPAVRFAIEDCVDLPECTTSQREAQMSSEQARLYKQLKNEATIALKGGAQITAANEAVLRMKLIQIACGAVYDGKHDAHEIDCADRIGVLKETISQATKKVIVFAPLTSVLDMLKVKLAKEFSCEIINGAVSDRKRSDIFRAFQQDDNPRVLLADPRTMAHGLNLVAATTIVWYAPIDSTELYLQANKRIHRPGQVHVTSVVQISSSPVEREIYRRLAANETLQGAVLKLLENQ